MSVLNDTIRLPLTVLQPRLTDKELDNMKAVTAGDVWRTVATIQSRQDAQRGLMNMTRLQAFLQAMIECETVSDALVGSSDLSTFVWGSMKFMLQTAALWPYAFDKLLEAYEQLGEVMPSLQQHCGLFNIYPSMSTILKLIYKDLLDFHRRAVRFFDQPNWRQLFRSIWKDFHTRFKCILKNLLEHRRLVEALATLANGSSYSLTFNYTHIEGNNYDQINVHDGPTHIGDYYHSSKSPMDDDGLPSGIDSLITQQLTNLAWRVEEARILLEQQEKTRHDVQCSETRDWVAGPSMTAHHESAMRVRSENSDTGRWIMQNEKVSKWMKEDLPRKSMLWMHGVPGAGKTILASEIIDACKEVADSNSFYFYCKYDDPATCTSMSILKGLLVQVLRYRRDLFPYFEEQRRKDGQPVLEAEKLVKHLVDVSFRSYRRTYVVLDGLDECTLENRKSLLSFFDSLVQENDQKQLGKFRLLVVSQNEADIKRALIAAEEFEIQPEDNYQDIESFVSRRVAEVREKFELAEQDGEIIRQRTCWQAAGQFLYARLVMENLYAQPNLRSLREELLESHFPKALGDAYERIIARIRRYATDDEWFTAEKLLGWMTCAARPLNWHELQRALSIDVDNEAVDFDELQLRRHIHDICGALVKVSGDRIGLVHRTARDFISKSNYIDASRVECKLATLCLQYLCFRCFDIDTTQTELNNYVFHGYFAFADYAVAKWAHHFNCVLSLANVLSNEDRWSDREVAVQELCEAVEDFNREHLDDLEASQESESAADVKAQLHPNVTHLISSFPEAAPVFLALWTHIGSYRSNDSRVRNSIRLERLSIATKRYRESLEGIAADRELDSDDRRKLKRYYGDRVFRCSRITCFYFHEGYKDKKARDKHVARHERPWQCEELDCESADFGFASKRDLDKHTLAFHPDMEMKAKLFKPVVVKTNNTHWRCEKCDKSFARNSILKAHELSHAGQKPYECSRGCGRAFTRKNDCTRHEKIHDNRR